MASLDAWFPEYDVCARYERPVAVPPEEAFARALAQPVAADRLVRLLFRLRGGRPSGTLGDAIARLGDELDRTPTSVVMGASARPWARGSRMRPLAEAPPDAVRIGFVLAAEPGRLWTETRVAATSERARRVFRRYWLVVGPFSGLIRRRWLRAATR